MVGPLGVAPKKGNRVSSAVSTAMAVVFLLVLGACTGSLGGGGCGAQPVAHPELLAETRVDHAATVRLTRAGLSFLADNGPSLTRALLGDAGGTTGILTFPIPTSQVQQDLTLTTATIDICPGGPDANANPPNCIAEIGIKDAAFHLDAVTPNALRVSGTLPVRVRNLPLNVSPLVGGLRVGVGSGQCDGEVPNFTFKAVPITLVLPLVAETVTPRAGFTTVDVANAVIEPGLVSDDVALCKECLGGWDFGVCNAIFSFVKGLIFEQLKAGVVTAVRAALDGALCTKPDPAANPPCPAGSQPDDPDVNRAQKCLFVADGSRCMPVRFGTDGHFGLGGLLAAISPGASSEIDFLLAAGGPGDPAPGAPADDQGWAGHTPNGMTLGMVGGALAAPASKCVSSARVPDAPKDIPVPDELRSDVPLGDGKTAHVEMALSGRFLNYTLGQVYKSGALCLGVTTERFPALDTGLVSALIPSLKNLSLERKPAAVALTARPGEPPVATLGGGTNVDKDPLVRLSLKQFAVDFHVWSYDRFTRAFTFTADVEVPMNLQPAASGLEPTLGTVTLTNALLTNTDQLAESDGQIAVIQEGLAALVGGLAKQLLGSALPAIPYEDALASFGVGVKIPAGGLRKLTKGTDDFVGVFGELTKVEPQAKIVAQAAVVEKVVDPRGLTLRGVGTAPLPRLHVRVTTEASEALEVAWSIDQGTRSPWRSWAAGEDLWIDDAGLFLQGRHLLKVAVRRAGEPSTEGVAPAVPFVLDALPPVARLEARGGRLHLAAWDVVTPDDQLVARLRGADGTWSPWGSLADVEARGLGAAPGSGTVEAEVRDEEGNVASVGQALVRGRVDGTLPTTSNGCGCSLPGQEGGRDPGRTVTFFAVGGFVVLLALRGRLRRRSAAFALAGTTVLAALNQGCSCGDDGGASAKTGCGTDCNQTCEPSLPMGLVGSYTSVAAAKDGTLWVAGYNDMALPQGNAYVYGDLVVGKYDRGKGTVAWRTVDGLPAPASDGTCSANDPSGWRRGHSEAGDNVGLDTSIALDENGRPFVSYYDATHGTLKFAWLGPGDLWIAHTVLAKAGADVGRHAKMIVDGGVPVIAFLVRERGSNGRGLSRITVARGKTPIPGGTGDWSFEDAALDENAPCRGVDCEGGQVCVVASGTCQGSAGGCPAACGAGEACVTVAGQTACSAVLAPGAVETYSNAFGAALSLAKGPADLGMAVYDRVRGNLVGLERRGNQWVSTVFDGEVGSRRDGTAKDTGDVGAAASLLIGGDGTWHVAYVDGITETLRYVRVVGGRPGAPEVVDDGFGDGVRPFADGKHLVGDDAALVETGGTITVFYQDASAGTLRMATRGDGGAWTLRVLEQPGRFAGYFPRPVPGTDLVANFWRAVDRGTRDTSGDVAFVRR